MQERYDAAVVAVATFAAASFMRVFLTAGCLGADFVAVFRDAVEPPVPACSFCFRRRYSRRALAGSSPLARAILLTWNSANFCLRSGVHAFEIARFCSA